jgi:2-dehydro-3-deoxygalactonokinase
VFATIDCGTTNSRVYVLDAQLRVLAQGAKKIGVRDTAISGSRQALREGLGDLFATTVRQAGLGAAELECAVTSGMITSEIGLLEIPHLWAPAGREELAAHLTPVRDPDIFPADVELLFIPGIKNAYPRDATCADIRRIDFMRGEETQVMGLLRLSEIPAPPWTAVVLSSHTKFIPVTADGRIAGSLTTLSGQVFEAIRQSTSVGKSIEAPEPTPGELDPEVVESAYDAVLHAGFLRALLMPRFLEVLLGVPAPRRRLFLDAAIATEDLQALHDFALLGFATDAPMVLIGAPARCGLFRFLLRRQQGSDRVIREVTRSEEVDRLSILGAVSVAQSAGYLRAVGAPA